MRKYYDETNEEYERGYEDGRRQALQESEGFSEEKFKELVKKHNLKIVDKRSNFYTLADSNKKVATGCCFSGGRVSRVWITVEEEERSPSDVEYIGRGFDDIRSFYNEVKDLI